MKPDTRDPKPKEESSNCKDGNRAKVGRPPLLAGAEATFFSLAFLSFAYAVVTAPAKGLDLAMFQDLGQAWVSGGRQLPFYGYPPFTAVLFAPLCLLSFDGLRFAFLAVNIAATAVVLYLVFKLWGGEWPAKARFYLAAILVSWAPFRVTLRNGQLSLIITSIVLGALLARESNRRWLAGALLGISLFKYPLTFPFFLYFVWKREWKIIAGSLLIPAVLTEVFALRSGISAVESSKEYARQVTGISMANASFLSGSTDLKPLILALTGGREPLPGILALAISIIALSCMAVVFSRRSREEKLHFSALAIFSLWSVYHRSYDAVICILPAASLVDFIVRKRFVRFSAGWLGGLGLFAIGIPGLLTDRLHLSVDDLSGNFLGLAGLHAERVLLFVMFWSLLWLLWKSPPTGERVSQSNLCAEPSALG